MTIPEFEATTTMGNISLNDYKGKWVVLFSHPGDFKCREGDRPFRDKNKLSL